MSKTDLILSSIIGCSCGLSFFDYGNTQPNLLDHLYFFSQLPSNQSANPVDFFQNISRILHLSAQPPWSKPSSALFWMVQQPPKWSPSFGSCSSQSLLNTGVGEILLKCKSDRVPLQLKASVTLTGSLCTTSKVLHGPALHYLSPLSPHLPQRLRYLP